MAKNNYIINTSPKTRWNQTLNIKANLPFARKKRKMNNPTPIFFFLSLFPFPFSLSALTLLLKKIIIPFTPPFSFPYGLPIFLLNPSFAYPKLAKTKRQKHSLLCTKRNKKKTSFLPYFHFRQPLFNQT